MAIDPIVTRLVGSMLEERRKRAKRWQQAERYYDGKTPFPEAVVRARLTDAYRTLMPMATAPWGSLIVDSSLDRLEIAGLRSEDSSGAKKIWRSWQANDMDAESKIGHKAALMGGRCFATVWPDDDGEPEIVLDNPDQMVVKYVEGRRRAKHAVAALRFWREEDDSTCITVYTRDYIFKFKSAKRESADRFEANGDFWEPRIEPGEDWPLENPYGVVPVVEVAINQRLKPGPFPYARGEYEHLYSLLDRINLLTFLGLVVALWLGFPLRGLIGGKIIEEVIRFDDGTAVFDETEAARAVDAGEAEVRAKPPFDAEADSMFHEEDPNAKIAEFKAAERKNLSVFAELDQLAVISKTPRHYFPLEQGMSNISADAIRASEGGLHAKATGYKAEAGQGWENVDRLVGLQLDPVVELPPGADVLWLDHESRSMGERVDAASKLGASFADFPWQFIAEKFLNLSQDEISRIESSRAREAVRTLLNDPSLQTPPTPEMPVGANGRGGAGQGSAAFGG